MSSRAFTLTVLMGLCLSLPIGAATIFSNVPVTRTNFGGVGIQQVSDIRVVADDFSIVAPAVITGFTFWSQEPTAAAGGFSFGNLFWELRQDDAGLPGSLVYSGVATLSGGVGIAQVIRTLEDLTLFMAHNRNQVILPVPIVMNSPGQFWLTLGHQSSTFSFFWASCCDTGNVRLQAGPDPTWYPVGTDSLFTIEGEFSAASIPEPSTLGSVFLALAWITRAVWRKRSSDGLRWRVGLV